MSNSVRPQRRQPTRLPCPWDSPGKNSGVGCHFLLQCRKVKSESEVAQSCPTLSGPMDCSLPGSSVHGIFQARVLEWGAIAFSVSYTRSSIFFVSSNKTLQNLGSLHFTALPGSPLISQLMLVEQQLSFWFVPSCFSFSWLWAVRTGIFLHTIVSSQAAQPMGMLKTHSRHLVPPQQTHPSKGYLCPRWLRWLRTWDKLPQTRPLCRSTSCCSTEHKARQELWLSSSGGRTIPGVFPYKHSPQKPEGCVRHTSTVLCPSLEERGILMP